MQIDAILFTSFFFASRYFALEAQYPSRYTDIAMRSELEKRLKRQRAELDAIEKDKVELASREAVCKAIIAELEGLLRLAPKEEGETVEKALRVNTDPYHAREVLRKNRGPLHVKEILERIGGDTGRNRRSSLASQLGAYARKTEIFTKPGPNVFGLIDYGPIAPSLDQERFSETLYEVSDITEITDSNDGWTPVEEEIPF